MARATPSSDPTLSVGSLVRKRRAMLALSGLLAAIGAAAGLVPYYLIYLLALQLFNGGSIDTGFITTLALGSVAAVITKGVTIGLSTHLSHIAAYTILYDLRIEVGRKLGTLPLGYFSDRTTGEIKKVIHEDVEQLEEGLAHMIPDLVAGLTVPIVTAIILFIADWRMALATIALVPIAVAMYGWAIARMGGGVKQYNAIAARMNGAVIQYINGMKVLKTFTRADASFADLRHVIDEMRDFYVGAYSASVPALSTMLTFIRANLLTIVPVGTLLYLNGSLDIPTFVLFIVLGMGFNRPLFNLFMNYGTAAYQVSEASKRVAKVLAEPSLLEPSAPQQPRGSTIEFKHVVFGYTDGPPVLRDINITFPQGSVTALVGPSGAGKTTIARLIPRFWDVTAGEVLIGGVDIRQMTSATLMDQVAFVFQDVFLFNDTVYENIRVGKPDATKDEIIAAAKAARCHEFIVNELPAGYDSPVGENGARLSGGQKQRISIARAILKDAPIIVLDEATAFVDPENEAQIQEALAALMRSDPARPKTFVIVAHRLSTITEVDQILVVDNGEIVASGTHERLVTRNDLYRKLWDAHIAAQAWQPETDDGPRTVDHGPHTQTDSSSIVHRPSSDQAIPNPKSAIQNPYAGLDPHESLLRTLFKLVPNQRRDYMRGIVFKVIDGMFAAWPGLVVFLILLELFRQPVNTGRVWVYVGVLVVLFVGQFVFTYLSQSVFLRVLADMQRDLRVFLGDYLRRLPLGFFTRRDAGTIDSLFTTNIMFLDIRTPTEMILGGVVGPSLLFVAMLLIDWRLALAVVLGVPFALLVMRWADRIFAQVWQAQSAARTRANSRMVEYIQGIGVIRAFNLAGARFDQFRQAIDTYRAASIHTQTKLTPAIVGFLATVELGFAALIVIGSLLFANGAVGGETLLLFLLLSIAFYQPMMALGELASFQRIVQNSVRNVNEFLQSPLLPEPTEPRVPQDTTIVFENVHFQYDDRPVLNGVSFTIPPRSMTALVGPSGSGKTTITNLIARFWDVTEGRVCIGGVDVRDMTSDVLLSQITMVFQDVYLFNDTIRNNIRLGKPDASDDEIVAAARAACCHDFISAMPDGYDSVVGEGGATLSGGQKQRISIARAILKDAPIVLLDEATASIDPPNERQIQQALNALVAHKTLIIIAHRLPTVQTADQILVIDGGRVVQRGTHRDLIAQDGLYRRFWQERERARSWKLTSDIAARALEA